MDQRNRTEERTEKWNKCNWIERKKRTEERLRKGNMQRIYTVCCRRNDKKPWHARVTDIYGNRKKACSTFDL